jgi:signal transduction histidine kinase
LIPIVQKDIIGNLSEAIIVVDNEGKVIHHNNSFLKNFPVYERNKAGKDFQGFIGYLKQEAKSTVENGSFLESLKNLKEREYSAELTLKAGQCFLATIKPIFAFKTEFAGRIISLTDITEYKKLKEAEFDVIKERNRIAQDVHDTLGHKMTLLLYLLEAININYERNPAFVKDNIQKAIQTAGEGYEELRRSIYGLTFKESEIKNLLETLRALFTEFTTSGMEIDFSIEGRSEHYDESYSHIIYRICQEALTNSFKHGKAKKVSIVLQFIQQKIKLYIFDNGTGCKNIKMGVGLHSMGQRIKDLNGTFMMGSTDDGFYINVELQ